MTALMLALVHLLLFQVSVCTGVDQHSATPGNDQEYHLLPCLSVS